MADTSRNPYTPDDLRAGADARRVDVRAFDMLCRAADEIEQLRAEQAWFVNWLYDCVEKPLPELDACHTTDEQIAVLRKYRQAALDG